MDGTMSTKQERKTKIEGSGRKKGSENKVTKVVKDAILEAATQAGAAIVQERYGNKEDVDPRFIEDAKKQGMVYYLLKQAEENPQSFNNLLGRVLPYQVNQEVEGEVQHVVSLKWKS